MEMSRQEAFASNRNAAKKNLTRKLGRNPTGAEILGLVGARRRGENENSFFARIQEAAEKRIADAAESRMKQKAAKMEAKLLQPKNMTKKIMREEANAAKAEEKEGARQLAKMLKEEAMRAAKAAKEEAREEKRLQAAIAKKEAAQLYEMQKAAAAQNLRSVLGKNPRMANVLRLAGIRRSGANISVNDFLKVSQRGKTLKKGSSAERLKELNGFSPDMDVCAQCELKKFLENQD
jgi:hypothetical protein